MSLVGRLSFVSMVFLVFFSGCFMWGRGRSVSREEYVKMVNGSFSSVSDVVALLPTNVSDVEQRVRLAIEVAERDLKEILSVKSEDRSFDNTARLYDEAGARFGVVQSSLSVAEMIHPDDSIRAACHDALVVLQSFVVDKFLNVDLYNAFKVYVDGNAKREVLGDEERYFLSEEMRDFRRSGLHLPDEKLVRVKALQKELATLSLEFSKNLAEDRSCICVSRDELKGVSDDFMQTLKQDENGKFVIYCDYPSRTEVLNHCSVGQTRKAFFLAFGNRAYPANKVLLDSIILKRDELARLLGFSSYAHFDLDDQMAKSPERAGSFIRDLVHKVEKKEQSEFDRLSADLPEGVQLKDGKIEMYDNSYAKECYRKKHFSVDDREIAEYFPMEKTIEGIFDIYQKFLHLDFKLLKPSGLWHEDAMVIEVCKRGESGVEGYIFLDLHPRQNKYNHACCSGLVYPVFDKSGKSKGPSVSIVIANFPKSTKDKPSLLTHSDVTTFFHEFGHAMHLLLGRTKMYAFSGYNTKHDFVEVPSQMFEEWMWDRDMLKMVSSHYKTGNSLPSDLIDKMIELKRFDYGYFVQRQCCLSLFSLDCYLSGGVKDLDAIEHGLFQEYVKNMYDDTSIHFYASFGHLTGYAAKYYCYLWSKAYALDVFDCIKKVGLLDADMGKKLIAMVLGRGGSVEPEVLLRDFLGRDSMQDAFLKDIGLQL